MKVFGLCFRGQDWGLGLVLGVVWFDLVEKRKLLEMPEAGFLDMVPFLLSHVGLLAKAGSGPGRRLICFSE